MSSRSSYQITPTESLEEILTALNSVLASIGDRLDKIEGVRGTLEAKGGKFSDDVKVDADILVRDSDEKTIHSME